MRPAPHAPATALKNRTEPTEAPRERVVVAALILPGSEASKATEPLAEIIGLVEAAGAEVVATVTQRLPRPHPRTAFGKGKVEEIGELARETGAGLVVVDFDLSPGQGRNLEKDLDLRLVDRTELILDIFVSRARTRQAKLQVELAQAEYMRPRLTRIWTHLERTEGAIGTRGPGETQLETDRRLVNRKISDLKRRLGEIEDRSRRQAQSRNEISTVSLVGYTNAGKSSLMKALTGADVYIADQLFATLDTRVRRWDLEDGRAVLLADTVGFVRDLPHHLVASFHATLEETLNADLLLHVCDATDPDLEVHLRAVEEVLSVLGGEQIASLQILNKIDLLPEMERELVCRRYPEAIPVSALSGNGLDQLEAAVAGVLDRWSLCLEVEIPAAAGRLMAEFRKHCRIEAEAFEGETWRATVRLLPRTWTPLRIEVERVGGSFSARPGAAPMAADDAD